jgi:hypothetical protein
MVAMCKWSMKESLISGKPSSSLSSFAIVKLGDYGGLVTAS